MNMQPYGRRFEQATRCRECGADMQAGECPFCEVQDEDDDLDGECEVEELELG